MKSLKVVAAVIGVVGILASTVASAVPDLSGVWQVERRYSTGRFITDDGLPPPMTLATKAEADYLDARDKDGKQVIHNTQMGWPKGFIQASRAHFNFEIFQQPKQLSFFFEEDSQYNFIYIDAKHPANVKPGFLGDSVAHWDGDTLVIDTVGYNGEAPLNNVQMSSKTHTTMRLRLINDGKSLENNLTIDDPVGFTRTWVMKIIYDREPPSARIGESVYAEANADLPDLSEQ